MKRFYSVIATAIVALVSLTVLAQKENPISQRALDATRILTSLTKADNVQTAQKVSSLSKQRQNTEFSVENGMQKAPAKAHESDTWKALGECTFTDDFSTIYGITNSTYQVEIEESNENPGLYRLIDPMKGAMENIANYNGVTNTYDDSYVHYMYIDATNPDQVFVENFQTGLTILSSDGELGIYNGVPYGLSYGTLQDGIISFPAKSLLIRLGEGTSLYYGNTNGKFQVVLPGVEAPKDYSLTVSTQTCRSDNKISFSIVAGNDVAEVYFDIFTNLDPQLHADAIEYVAEEKDADMMISGGSWSMNGTWDPARYTVVVAGFDAEGNYIGGSASYTYVTPTYSDAEWESLGTVDFTDDLIGPLYDFGVTTHEVELQENIATPGFYRVVNPYANWAFDNYNGHATNHNHYLYIHAEDPENVYINDQPVGVDLGDGGASIKSDAAGTLADGKITFPQYGLLEAEQTYEDGAWLQTNYNGAFCITVPDKTGLPVKDQIDFASRDIPMSSGNGATAVSDGDITETTTFVSDKELFTAEVTVSGKTTPNRIWSNSGKPQLRVYGGSVTIAPVQGQIIEQVVVAGSNLTGTGTGSSSNKKPKYTVNGMTVAELTALEGCSAENAKLTLTGIVGFEEPIVITFADTSGNLQINNITVTFGDAALAAATADMDRLEDLQGDLTQFIAGKDEYITPDVRQAIETIFGDTWATAIEAAYTDAVENGTDYESPIDWDMLQTQINWIKEQIEGVMNGTIAIYTENGVVGDGTANGKNLPFFNTEVGVEVYANGKVTIKAWDGVEGSDLTVVCTGVSVGDETMARVTYVEQTVNGEVVSEYMEDEDDPEMSFVVLQPQATYSAAVVFPFNEMSGILLGEGEEYGMGALSLMGMFYPAATGDVDPGFGVDPVQAPYMVQWPGEAITVPAEMLYEAKAETIDYEDASYGDSHFANSEVRNIGVEVYDNQTVVLRGWAGVAGYDVKVAFDEDENVTAVTPIVNGVEGTTVTSGYCNLKSGDGKTLQVYVAEGYNYAGEEDGEGYVMLYGYLGGVWGYYAVEWPQFPELAVSVAYNDDHSQAVVSAVPTVEGSMLLIDPTSEEDYTELPAEGYTLAWTPGMADENGVCTYNVEVLEVMNEVTDNNLWNTGNPRIDHTYYSQGDSWSIIGDINVTAEDGIYNVSLPQATNYQWQAQVFFHTDIKTSADKAYDLRVAMRPNVDMSQVTVKFVHQTDDGIFFTDGRHDLAANQNNVIELNGVEGKDIDGLRLVLDFGGNQPAEVEISNIMVKESGLEEVEYSMETVAQGNATVVLYEPQVYEPEFDIEKVYTINNKIKTDGFWQDLGNGVVNCYANTNNDASYWNLIATDKDNCYRIKNLSTGKFLGAHADATEVELAMVDANEAGEYYIEYCEAEGAYGIACTDASVYDFTAGCVGLNLKKDPNENGCCVQTYAAVAGTNHRSFWTINAVKGITTSINAATASDAKVKKMIENGQLIIIRDGKKYNAAGAILK